MGAVQDEDNGLTWEANSSRCSTSQASETSATSGVYSLENSYVDSPTEIDEGQFGHRRTCNSPNQEPSSPNQKREPDNDNSAGQMQEKAEDIELDLANPKSWPYQVQPSKIKDYLVQITQEVEPLVPEEKDNALKKKGELPLEGTVRARIQLITAVLEERNKKIFRRVNKKDLPPPPPQPVIRRPREPKKFPRQGIFVPLRHVEREAAEKNQKREPVRYNLKPVQTNVSKAGASVPYHKVERRIRPSFLSETQNKASEKPTPVLPSLADKANKLDAESYSQLESGSFAPPNHEDKQEKKERHSLCPEREKAGNILDETKKLEGQHYLPVTTKATDISEESSSLPERTTAKPFPPASVEPLPGTTNEPQIQSQWTVAVPSDSMAQEKQCPANILLAEHEHLEHPVLTETRDQDIEPRSLQPEINDAAMLHSAEESRKQDVSPHLPVVAESAPDQVKLSCSVSNNEKQEMRQVEVEHAKQEEPGEQLTLILQAEPQHQHLVRSRKEAEGRETEMLLDSPPIASRTETQEPQNYPHKAAEENSGPPQPTFLMGEAKKMEEQPLPFNLAKEAGETQTAVTSSPQPACPEEAPLSGDKENESVPLASQPPDISLSSPESQREEHSAAIARPGSEHPVISEPVKVPPRSKGGKSSQLKEASTSPPAEAVDLSEQLPIISSAVTETVEKEDTWPSTLITVTPLLEEQPSFELADQAEQMEEQDNPPCSPETPTLVLDTSLSALPVQPTGTTNLEAEQYSPTQAPSEASVSVLREPDVAIDRVIIQPDSLLHIESPPEASVPFQEAVKLENQVCPPLNARLYSEEGDVTHPSRDDGQQEGNVSLHGTTPFEREHSTESKAREHNIKENSSTLSQLEETIALRSVNEAEKKDVQSERSFLEPLHPDSLSPICVPEKQERVQSETGQTAQHLSLTALQTESDLLPSVNEIDGMQAHLPAAVQDVSKPACLTETQEDKGLPTGTVTLDSGSVGIPYTIAGAEELELKQLAKQIIQPVTTELEPNYPKESPSVSESDLDIAFPAPSTDFQAHMLVTPRSKEEYPVPSEKNREEIEPCSSITPTSELKIPPAGAETQESPSCSPDAPNEVPKPTPSISAFLPVHVKVPAVPEESISSSTPPLEQANLLSPDLKAEIEESQFPFPEMPKTDPEELLSTTTFPIGETRDGAPSSPMDTQIVPEESKSAPKDFAPKGIKEMDLTPSTLPAELFSEESISLHAVDGEKGDRSHILVTAESEWLAAGKTDVQVDQSRPHATAQSETKNLDIEPYCPGLAESEQKDVTSLSREEIKKQEMPLCSFSTVQPELVDQGLLHEVGGNDDQEKIPLEIDISKVQNAPLQPPIQQQVPECLNLQQSETQLEMKETQPSSFATVLDSSWLITETENGICRDSLFKTAENDYEVSVLAEFMDESRKQETQPPQHEAAQLECEQSFVSAKEKEQITFPPVTAPLDQGHVGLVSSPEPQFSPPEALNQTSEQPPSASPLRPEEVEKQEVNSCSPAEEPAEPKIQPHPPKVENVISEEPFSIAAFLLSEAKEIQTSLPRTTEKDTHPPFEEAGLLIEKPGSAVLPEMNGTIKEEIHPLLTHFESQQLSSKPQAEVTDLEKRGNIADMPTTPNFTVKQPSNTLLLEPVNYTHTQNIPSPISSVDSDSIKGKKATVITAEDLSKTKEIPCLSHAEKTLQDSEKDLQKEKGLTRQEKVREDSVSSPECDSSNTSEDYKVVSTHAPPFISPADEEENKHTAERLEYLETVSSLKTKPFHDVGDVIDTHDSSVFNLCTNISEGLTEGIHDNKVNESKEMVGEMRVQRNVETEKQSSACPEKKNDRALNVTSRDYFEKHTMIDGTSFTQTGKEQSAEVIQRLLDITKESLEEATGPPANSKNTLDASILEGDLGEDFYEMVKRDNTTAAKEETAKMSKEDRLIDAVRKNDKEDELNLAGAPLRSSEKDIVAQSPETPVQDTAHNPELLEVPPALSFLYKDLYEEVMAEPKNDSGKHLPNEETENTGVPSHRSLDQVTSAEAGIYFEKDTPKDEISNNLEESQIEQVLKDQPIDEQVLSQTRVSQGVHELHEKKREPLHNIAEVHAKSQVLIPGEIVTGQNDALLEGPTEIVSDIKVTTCQPAFAIPFGSRFSGSGASNDESSPTRGEDDLSTEAGPILPEETSDDESCPILDYAATLYPEEASVQGESTDATCLTADQHQQSEVTEVHKVDQAAVTKPVEESTQLDETFHQIISPSENEEQLENHFGSVFTVQDARAFDHDHPTCWEAEEAPEEGVDEDVCDLRTHHREATNQQYTVPEVKSDATFGELDYSLLSHDFDTYPLYSIKEEEYSDIDEDLAELMDYEMVDQDDVFREETSSEVAREDDRQSLDHISNTYEFVNESEANTYAEDEEFALMGLEKFPKNVPESEDLQKEMEQAQFNAYCNQCQCLICVDDKLLGNHKEHNVTNLDTAATELKVSN